MENKKQVIVMNHGIMIGKVVSGKFVSDDFITFEGKTHDGFMTAFLAICGMSLEYLETYRQHRDSIGTNPFVDQVVEVVSNIRSLKGNQMPLSDYQKMVSYYQQFVVNGASVTPGSGIEKVSRRK